MVVPTGPSRFNALPGGGSVTPSGEYRYEIPIEVPPGRRGMQPHLSLVYSSNAGNGPLGVGFSLEGLSSIKPCAKTVATEGKAYAPQFNNDDALCWDGRKLVSPDGGPVAGGGQLYRTEEEVFAKIQKVDPSTFRIWTKDGKVLTFSSSVNGNQLFDYVLTQEEDRSGNGVTYEYDVVPAPGTVDGGATVGGDMRSGEYYPKKITYTSQTQTGEPGQRSVEFKYDVSEPVNRPDPFFMFRRRHKFSITRRLDRIDCFAPNPTLTENVWSYLLSYHDVPAASGRTLLDEVRRTGALNGSTLATQFGWESTKGPTYKQLPGVVQQVPTGGGRRAPSRGLRWGR